MVNGRKKRLNFIAAAKRNTNKPKISNTEKVAGIILASLALFFVMNSSILLKRAGRLKQEAEQIRQALSNYHVVNDEERLQVLKKNLQKIEQWEKDKERIDKYFNIESKISGQDLNTIMAVGSDEVFLHDIEYLNESLLLTGTTKDYRNASDFARKLKETGLFYDVIYTGFEGKNGYGTENGTFYYFEIVIKTREE